MLTIHIRRKLKGFFFLFRLDLLTPSNIFNFLTHTAKLSRWISKNKKISYSDFYSFKINYNRRYDLYKYLVESENLSREIDLHRAIGADYLLCPWIPPEERGGESFYRALAEELNRIGERCRANGLQFCYHHHAK